MRTRIVQAADRAWVGVLNARGIDIGEPGLRTFLNKVSSGADNAGQSKKETIRSELHNGAYGIAKRRNGFGSMKSRRCGSGYEW